MADETMNVVFFFFETELVECQCPLVRRHFQQGASVSFVDRILPASVKVIISLMPVYCVPAGSQQ